MLQVSYGDDCLRIQKVLLLKLGYWCEIPECQEIWKTHSDRVCAHWLILPDSDERLGKALKGEIT